MNGIFNNVKEAHNFVMQALNNARNETSSLSLDDEDPMAKSILRMQGMSGKKWRHFLNNIVGSKKDLVYLEVGSWIGSTFCSSLYMNHDIGVMISIDNYSQFINTNSEALKDTFKENVTNIAHVMGVNTEWANKKLKFYECDFENFSFEDLSNYHSIDVYLFDGPHKMEDQYNGIVKAYPGLSDVCVVLVDDWNWNGPRLGTYKAFEDLGVNIEHQFEIFTAPDGFIPANDDLSFIPNRFAGSDWHNGVAVFIITK